MDGGEKKRRRRCVGGEKQYNKIVGWASENLPKPQIDAFDSLINTGNTEMIKLAVAGLNASYTEANGYEGRTLQGKPAQSGGDTFRSQAEVVKAMRDSRYERDPAYRQDIQDKLSRSNINF